MADPKLAAQPASVPPAQPTVIAAPAAQPGPVAALSVIFSQPTWQSTKPNAAKRLADVQLVGTFAAMPHVAIAGITIAQEDRSVIVYLPSASRVGPAKAITARTAVATQTMPDGTTESVMVPDRRGEREIGKLESAIIDAWVTANTGMKNPYGVEIPLSL